MMGKSKTITIELDQEQANLVLRAVEILEEACVAAVEEKEAKKLQLIWNKVFDAGLNANFGIRNI
jgi:hypothetical protein